MKKANKYYSRRTVCSQGHNHPSKIEAEYCDMLILLVRAKEIDGYKQEPKFDLKVNGVFITRHKPDFLVTRKGELEIHEVKGFETQTWKIKKKLFEAIYPQYKYIVIK